MTDKALYKLSRIVTATPANAQAGGGRIMAVSLESGAGACSVDIHAAASDVASSEIITLNSGAAVSQFFDFTELGGIACATGVWVVPTGTGAICYVWTG